MASINILLYSYAKMWQHSLHMERTFGLALRMPFSFPDIDRYGEALCALLSGLKGSGTKGSGADLTDGRIQDEVKTVCLCQPSRCTRCDRRSPWSDTVCAHCGNADLERMTDSRFGINAAAHLKDKDTLRQYWCVALEHVGGEVFQTTVWTIQSSNSYFTAYVEQQAKQSSKTCNLLPRSYDFVLSGAKRVFQVQMTLPVDMTVPATASEPDRTEVPEVLSCAVLKQSERVALGLDPKDAVTCVAVERALEVLGPRKKAHGKARGTTSRGVGGDSD